MRIRLHPLVELFDLVPGDLPSRRWVAAGDMKTEGEPAQHGDWPTRREVKAVVEPTARTAGDSLERKVLIGNLYSKYSRNPRLVRSVLDSNSVTAGEVPI